MRAKALREGSLGLFVVGGFTLLAALGAWLNGLNLNVQSYGIKVRFDNVNGMKNGADVRYRGLSVGTIRAIDADPNGVSVEIEIHSTATKMPPNLLIEANQGGLVGETTVDIFPQQELAASAQDLSPLDRNCDPSLLVCANQELSGVVGVSFDVLLRSANKFTNAYTDPVFVKSVNDLTSHTAQAALELANLGKELTQLSASVRQEVGGFGDVTSQVAQTMESLTTLSNNVNGLVMENQKSINNTLKSMEASSSQLEAVMGSLDNVINNEETKNLAKNLADLTANASAASANFLEVSETLAEPTNLYLLQETLDSARATFANAQKLTADLEDITGDPAFRSNLKKLVEGLSDLVSSTENLERQVYTAQQLEPLQRELLSRTQGITPSSYQ